MWRAKKYLKSNFSPALKSKTYKYFCEIKTVNVIKVCVVEEKNTPLFNNNDETYADIEFSPFFASLDREYRIRLKALRSRHFGEKKTLD